MTEGSLTDRLAKENRELLETIKGLRQELQGAYQSYAAASRNQGELEKQLAAAKRERDEARTCMRKECAEVQGHADLLHELLAESVNVIRSVPNPEACSPGQWLEWYRMESELRKKAEQVLAVPVRTPPQKEGKRPSCEGWFPLAWSDALPPGGWWWKDSAGCPGCGYTALVESECEFREVQP